ncbi:MAG TPA: hypothetical protein VFX11_08465 [Candidatus Kapabacteria bacterium]|nr:hypothetical protein [Candidatus Kapabacteria bacterium]
MHFPSPVSRNVLPRLVVSSAIALLTACGGGGGSNGGSSSATPTPVVQASTVSGTVTKGVISNGLVSVYALEDGTTARLLGSTRTDQTGHFSLNVTGYQGAVYIEVTAATSGEPTLMTCDSATGCGDFSGSSNYDSNNNGSIDFGERFAVSGTFMLSSALPSIQQSVSTSVSTLTHLAAQLAAQFPQGANEVSIAAALSQVQNLFGLDGSLTGTRLIDLTNPTAVSGATANELRYALLSGALMGLTNDVAFGETLAAFTEEFIINQGQLVQQDGGAGSTSYLDLVEQALATAQHLNLGSFVTELQQLKSTLQVAENGSLTDSQPAPTAGGATAAKIDAFVADLALWEGYLSLNPQQASFAQVVSAMGVSTGADLSNMLQAMAIAGQYGPIVALPDLALGAACDSLGNYLTRMTCRLLIAGKSLEDICEGTLNLVIFNRSLCDILNDLTLPLGAGVYGHFALYDGVVRIYGDVQDTEVDLTFTRASRSSTRYGFAVSGTVESAHGLLEINSGNVEMLFTGGLDIKNLKLPENANGTIQVNYQQFATDEHPDSMSFAGQVNLQLDLSNVRESDDSGETAYSGLDQIGIQLTAAGEFSSVDGDSFAGSLSISGGVDSNVQVRFETDLPDYSDRAVVTMTSSPANLAAGLIDTIRIRWAGKQYDIENYFSSNGIRITNQDGVIMDLDLSVEDGVNAGRILLNGTAFGSVSPLNGSLLIQLSNGSELVL